MYITILFLFTYFSFADVFEGISKRNLSICWIICFMLLVFQDGLRWETGTDWIPYSTYFDRCLELTDDKFEWGYASLSKLIRLFTSEYTVFLVAYALILYSLVFKCIKRHAINPFLSLFLYYCMTLPILGMNRQFLALGICLYSIRYIIEKRFFYFVACIGVAMLFHLSAIMFFIVYFFRKSFDVRIYIILLLIALGISFSGIVNLLPLDLFLVISSDTADRMESYAEGFISGNVVVNPLFVLLSLSKRLLWIVIIILYVYTKKKEDRTFAVLFNTYVFSLLFYIIFNNTILQIIVSRGLLFFNITEIFIIPYALLAFKNNGGKKILFLLLILFGIANLKKGIDAYAAPGETTDLFVPYKGIFINTDYVRRNL
jgi:hypothetical protein